MMELQSERQLQRGIAAVPRVAEFQQELGNGAVGGGRGGEDALAFVVVAGAPSSSFPIEEEWIWYSFRWIAWLIDLMDRLQKIIILFWSHQPQQYMDETIPWPGGGGVVVPRHLFLFLFCWVMLSLTIMRCQRVSIHPFDFTLHFPFWVRTLGEVLIS
jgi:hypothetical protein